ncbi:MAG: competence/damage-inducible protein A [Planctomycetes bacterium]|uniref:competence/damage-inducible protein A n=1 Tax=Candidatus Wunengus sp. YC65 TaxID=3367701 RepID=UPI001DB76338|nr:competence/damage-inducible protein A [Planctomycetota bacterium]
MTKAEIITIGSEIVLGQIVDTNTPYIAQKLSEKGIHVLFQTSVGDDKELLKSALKIARNRANLIITTGGLGPTANDITREAVSEFFDIPLAQDKDAFVRIQKYFGGQHRNVPDAQKKQTLIPEGALALHNDNGTATGFALNCGNTEIVCLPGVPREMQSMLNKYLEIYTKKHNLEGRCTLLRDLHTYGISEPDVEAQMKVYIEREEPIKIMTLVHDGIVTINILVTATTREDAEKILDRVEQDIRVKLGDAVFGVGDGALEHAVYTLLKKYNKTIAVAESCTGGLVSDKFTNIPGISEYFLEGVVAYSNKAKVDILGVSDEVIEKHGAVSPQVARAMVEGIKKRASANIGVGITGIAGPTGATKEKPVGLVYIAVAVDNDVEVKECRFKGSRIDIKNFSANTALNIVRLILLQHYHKLSSL